MARCFMKQFILLLFTEHWHAKLEPYKMERFYLCPLEHLKAKKILYKGRVSYSSAQEMPFRNVTIMICKLPNYFFFLLNIYCSNLIRKLSSLVSKEESKNVFVQNLGGEVEKIKFNAKENRNIPSESQWRLSNALGRLR